MSLATITNSTIPDSLKTISLFQNHLLAAQNTDVKFHYTHYDYLSAGILFLSFLLFVWLYVSNFKRLNQVIKGFFINRYANQLARDEISFGNRVTVFLSILFILTVSLFISQVFRYYYLNNISANFTRLYLISIATVLTIYFIKFISISIAGFIFQAPKAANEYTMALFLFGNTLGLFMLPVVICIAFVKQVPPIFFIYIGLSIISLFFFTRIVRGLIIWMNSLRASIVYLFLYLCALEILPFIVLVKLFTLLNS